MPPAHVLILGCGRSGTSIFGELFEDLSCYHYQSEPPYTELKTWSYDSPIAVKVPKESVGFQPTRGLSFPLEDLLQTIPSPRKIYWQVRHPLDTICSLKVGIAKNWGHHPRPADWEAWLSRPLIERCAHHWAYLNTIGYEQVADLAQLSRFEDMIADPLGFAIRIANEVGVDIDHHQMELQQWAQRVQNTNNKNFVEAKTSRPYSTTDHRVKVGRWKENLTAEEVAQVEPIIRPAMERMGYQIEG